VHAALVAAESAAREPRNVSASSSRAPSRPCGARSRPRGASPRPCGAGSRSSRRSSAALGGIGGLGSLATGVKTKVNPVHRSFAPALGLNPSRGDSKVFPGTRSRAPVWDAAGCKIGRRPAAKPTREG
jgi:hypothetical protein